LSTLATLIHAVLLIAQAQPGVHHRPTPPAPAAQVQGQMQPAPVPTATPEPQPAAPLVGYSTDPAVIQQEVIAAGDYYFGPGQGYYMSLVVQRESAFVYDATNPSSGALGLFQAYPASKLPCLVADIPCQMAWGVSYIRSVYGTPYGAWQSELSRGWY
jgi:hypothetical protein